MEWLSFDYLWRILQWITDKNFVSTLEAMQNLVQFNHQNEENVVKLRCTTSNLAKICLHISTIKKCTHFVKMMKICAKNLKRDDDWTINCVHAKSCCGRSVYQEFAKYLQISRDCTQTGNLISICENFKARCNRFCSFAKMVMFFIKKTDQMAQLRVSHIWKFLKKWRFQCKRILRSLQNSVWSYMMILPPLSLSGNSTLMRIFRGKTKEETRMILDGNKIQKWIQNWRDVGMWVVAKLQNKQKI